MNVFINTLNIIKYTFHKNSKTIVFYDNISDDDLSFLQKNCFYINMKTIYGTIINKNFSFSVVNPSDNDYNDIKLLLSNKCYNPDITISDVINSFDNNNKSDVPFRCNNIFENALNELMISTEQLKKNRLIFF